MTITKYLLHCHDKMQIVVYLRVNKEHITTVWVLCQPIFLFIFMNACQFSLLETIQQMLTNPCRFKSLKSTLYLRSPKGFQIFLCDCKRTGMEKDMPPSGSASEIQWKISTSSPTVTVEFQTVNELLTVVM